MQVSHPWQSFAPDVLFLAGGQDTRVHTLRLEMDAGNAVRESLERNVVQLHVLFRAAFGTAGARASPVRRGERERIVTVRVSGPWKATPADFRFPGVWLVLTCTRTLRELGICASFKGHFQSPRAKPKRCDSQLLHRCTPHPVVTWQ